MKINQNIVKKKGFTLTELLVSIATVGVIATLALTGISKVKHKARDVICLSNQRNIRIGMNGALTDVVPDESIHWNHDEYAEIQKVFYEDYSRPFLRDSLFEDLGLVVSKPLTCPYGLSQSNFRASFNTHWLKYFLKRPNLGENVAGVTGNYYFPINVPNDGYWDRTKTPAVECMWNYFEPREFTLGEYFNLKDHQNKSITVGTSHMHPHKGKGKYVTYWSGAQKWIAWKQNMMRVPDED